MEIIHLILGKANPNRMNGVNKVVNSLATYQSRLGYAVSVWGITSNMENNYPDRNYNTVLFPATKNKLGISKELILNVNKISNQTIFHIHGGFIPEFFHFSRKLVKAGINYVFTPHGAYNAKAMQKSKWTKKAYFSIFDKYVVKHAKTLHCIGQSELISFRHKKINTPSVLIPNGQNIEDLEFNYKTISQSDGIIFGFCGRIDIETKGLDLLLKGFSEFMKLNHEAQLWIIGDGPQLKDLKKLAAQLNITQHIKFWGMKFGEEKLNIISQMTAFYHPSRNEGLPGAVLEAAGLKVPCVVSKASNISTYIKDNNSGIALKKNSEEYIIKSMIKITNLVANNEIEKIKNNAYKMVKNDFNWHNIAQQLIRVYQA